MKKKLMALLLSTVMLCGALGFGSSAEVCAAAESEEVYTMIVACGNPPDNTSTMAYSKFKEIVEAESNGRLIVDIKDSAQLGAQRDYIEGLQMGTIQMAEINSAVLAAVNDSFMVFDLPYLINDMDHCKEVLESGIGDQLSASLEETAGLKVVGYQIFVPRSVYSAKGPINTPEDFKGLKIRVQETPVMVAAMELLGATAVPINSSERYMALQTGVVDAAENGPSLVLSQKEYEVTKYYSYTEHLVAPNCMVISADFFNKLPEDLQEIVLKAGKEGAAYTMELEVTGLEEVEAALQENGMVINQVEDKQAFKDIVAPLYEEYAPQIGEDIVAAFMK